MEERTMTNEQVMQELMALLKNNGMKEADNNVYELCAYIDSMTQKMQEMTEELVHVRNEIQNMKEDTLANRVKKSLSESADRMEKRCNDIKEQVSSIRTDVCKKAQEIVSDFQKKGKAALLKVAEFAHYKEKLVGIRERVKQGILDTDRTIAKLDAFGQGMREAGQKIANTFRTFADKQEVDYSQAEKKFSKTEVAKKPWQGLKKLFQNMELRLDAAIDKVDALSMDVQLNKMIDLHKELSKKVSEEREATTVAMVAEETKYQYGAEAFEAAVPDVPKKGEEKKVMDKTKKKVSEKKR